MIYLSEVASAVSIKQLFIEFRQSSCRGCHSFGPFVFLPTVSRCCDDCLQTKHEFQMMPLSSVTRNFDIPAHKVRESLPVVHCPRGNYGNPQVYNSTMSPVDLVSVVQMECLGIHIYGNKHELKEAVKRKHKDSESLYRSRLNKRRDKAPRGWKNKPQRPQLPESLTTKPRYFEKWLREWKCHGATDLPFWNPQKKTVESGVYCSACGFHNCRENTRGLWINKNGVENTAFTLDTIPQHFEHCEFVKKGYKFGDRYQFRNYEMLGLDFLVNEKGEVEPHPESGKKVPKRYLKRLSRVTH